MEKRFYTCIFDNHEECKVKTEFKLKPESLVEFCKICQSRKIFSERAQVFTFLATMSEEARQWYNWTKTQSGYKGDFSAFVNECVLGYFKLKGLTLTAVVEPDKEQK